MLKRICISFLLFFTVANADYNLYGEDKVVLGVNANYWSSNYVNVGFIGGYHYFFPTDWQFAGFRHGVRGLGSINYIYASRSGVSLSGIVDWSIDFNINDPIVWGAFAGFGIELIGANKFELYPAGNIGGAVSIDNTHKFEVSIGYPKTVGVKYLYMF